MSSPKTQAETISLHPVPLTLEGSSVLHQMMRVRWTTWRQLSEARRDEIARQAAAVLEPLERDGRSAVYSLLGHKGDLLFIHFRNSFDELKSAELQLAGLELQDFLEPASSYLSVVELGLYDSSLK